jgi:hypothetical protein
MRAVLIGLLFTVAAMQGASAGTFEESFGNTVVATRADGSVDRLYFNADHSYTVVRAGGTEEGQWTLSGDQFCMTPTGGQPACSPAPPADKRVGDSWQVGEGANAVTVSIVAGR